MSSHCTDRVSVSGAAASDSASGEARAPALRSGKLYGEWRASMNVYLEKHGAQGVHSDELSEEDWLMDEQAVNAWNKQTVNAARAAVRARGAAAGEKKESESAGDSKSNLAAGPVALTAEEKADRAVVAAFVQRSHKAFGTIYNAIPEEMRSLVAHIPVGWAYGLWKWLEKKFQSTEADNVHTLIRELFDLKNTADESFDEWRARVNKLCTLLEHAKEKPSATMYSFVMLDRLHPRFNQAVLALKNGTMLKDAEKIDWEAVAALLNAHDRNERQMAASAASADASAMAAQTKTYYGLTPGGEQKGSNGPKYPAAGKERRGSGSGGNYNNGRGREHHPGKDTRTCFVCGVIGHIARDCPKKKKSDTGNSEEQASSAIASDSTKKKSEKAFCYAVMMKPAGAKTKITNCNKKVVEEKKIKTSNQYEALQELNDNSEQAAAPVPLKRKRKVRFDLRKKLLAASVKKSAKKKAESADPAIANPKVMAATVAPTREFGIDSMASVHLSGTKAIFIKDSLKKCDVVSVAVANNDVVEVSQVGSVELHIDVAVGQTVTYIIDKVYYHPRFGANLLSVHSLKKSGWEFHCGEEETYLLTPQHKLKVRLSTERRLSILSCSASSAAGGEEACNSPVMLLFLSLPFSSVLSFSFSLLFPCDLLVVVFPFSFARLTARSFSFSFFSSLRSPSTANTTISPDRV